MIDFIWLTVVITVRQLLKIDKISYDKADFLDFIQQIW